MVHVLDSGKHKEKTYDADRNVATLQVSWVSRASAIQRKGQCNLLEHSRYALHRSQMRVATCEGFGTVGRLPRHARGGRRFRTSRTSPLPLSFPKPDPDPSSDPFISNPVNPGRAGRVQPGKCWHLFPRQKMEELAPYQLPEIMRTPLDSLCLQVRTLN